MKPDNTINITFLKQNGKEDDKEINNNEHKNKETFNVNKSQIITTKGNNIIEENTKIILKKDNYNKYNKAMEFNYEIELSKILAVGLVNLGNTCFMNSSLQCFYHCSEFTRELLKNDKYYEDKNGE